MRLILLILLSLALQAEDTSNLAELVTTRGNNVYVVVWTDGATGVEYLIFQTAAGICVVPRVPGKPLPPAPFVTGPDPEVYEYSVTNSMGTIGAYGWERVGPQPDGRLLVRRLKAWKPMVEAR